MVDYPALDGRIFRPKGRFLMPYSNYPTIIDKTDCKACKKTAKLVKIVQNTQVGLIIEKNSFSSVNEAHKSQ